ncbi:MAG: PAS domain S-box protein [Ignavibacteria bacterium]
MEQQEAGKALEESEYRYRQLVEFLSETVIIHSEGKISFINPSGVKLLKAESKEQIIGKAFISFVHPDNKNSVIERFKKLIIEDKESKYCEEKLIALDGSEIFLETFLAPFIFHGEWAILIVGRDITVQKQSVEALMQNEERFKTMVQNINGYIYSVNYKDRKAISSYNSPKCSSITGYSPAEYLDDPDLWLKMVYKDDQEYVLNTFNNLKKNLQQTRIEHRINHKQGHIAWISNTYTLQMNTAGDVIRMDGFIIDITARKHTEQLLIDSEEKYRTLAENSYDLISEISSDLKFLYLSPNSRDVLGYEMEDILYKNILGFVHPDDIPIVIASLRKDSGSITLRLRHKNGDWCWFESAGKKFITSSGEKKGVIVSRNIEERKQLEQQLIQTEKLMAVGELSAMIAHEFRNALTSVKMILQLQSESENLNASEQKLIGVAINSIYHMEGIVQNLLNFAHPTPVEMRYEGLDNILGECIPFIIMQSKKKDIKFTKKFDHSLPKMLLNVPAIKDIIINLLLNAVQSFDADEHKTEKRICISISKVITQTALRNYNFSTKFDSSAYQQKSGHKNEIILARNYPCALMEISDNGPGIDPLLLKKIFEPFFTTKEKGSGLGLPIVKRTVNSHGGVMEVESTIGLGTTFRIYLPINKQS